MPLGKIYTNDLLKSGLVDINKALTENKRVIGQGLLDCPARLVSVTKKYKVVKPTCELITVERNRRHNETV